MKNEPNQHFKRASIHSIQSNKRWFSLYGGGGRISISNFQFYKKLRSTRNHLWNENVKTTEDKKLHPNMSTVVLQGLQLYYWNKKVTTYNVRKLFISLLLTMKIPASIDEGSISPTAYVNKFSSPIQKSNYRVQQAQRNTHEGCCNVINLDIST